MLYRMQNSKGTFKGKGFVGADKVGYLKDSLSTKVMLETFPHYEWGKLTGIIANVSKSPNELGTYAFNIEITKDNPRITPLLQNGQTGNGYILIEEKTLVGYLSRSINKSAENLLY